MKSQVFFCGLIIFFSFLASADTLCSFPGPDESEDMLQLSSFTVSGPEEPVMDDKISVSFVLKNVGKRAVNLSDKGVYAAVRDPSGGSRDFGFLGGGKELSPGASLTFKGSFQLDARGRWSIWPAYEIEVSSYSSVLKKTVILDKKSPDYWHACQLAVCDPYCANGVRYYSPYIGQKNDCVYKEEKCQYGCDEEGAGCGKTIPATAAKTTTSTTRNATTSSSTSTSTSLTVSLTLTRPTVPREGILVPCHLSGRLYDFTYYSKTLKVRICPSKFMGGGCLSTPLYTCMDPVLTCSDEAAWFEEVTRVWAGEESFRMPGPMDYRASVSCNGTYLIQPMYRPHGDECEWKGRWTPTKANFVTLDGTSAEGYDFRFQEDELTAPGIEVRVGEFAPPAMSSAQGNFVLSVMASDRSGIQRIRIRGNYSASMFSSNESGPLEVRTVLSVTPLSKQCDSSPCDLDIPYIKDAKTLSIGLRIDACDSAGNSVSTSWTRDFPAEASGDLSIVAAEPVQSVYGAALVKDKATAFRVKVDSTFPYPVETKFRLTLSPEQWGLVTQSADAITAFPTGFRFPEIWGPIIIPANARDYEVVMPIVARWQREKNASGMDFGARMIRADISSEHQGPDIRVMPKPIGESAAFSAEIDPDDQVAETNEGNNARTSSVYNVAKTRRIRMMWGLCGSFSAINASYDRTERMRLLRELAKAKMEYVLGAYPIADSKIDSVFDTVIRPYCDRGYLESRRPDDVDYYMGVDPFGGGGQTNYGSHVISIGGFREGDDKLAHEMMHAIAWFPDVYSLDCYCSWMESYCELPNGTRAYCCYDIYGWEKDQRETEGIEPGMGCVQSCRHNESVCNPWSCCNPSCRTWCATNRGTLHGPCPDGRIRHPATPGLWVNRYLVINESHNYFMDTNWPVNGTEYPWYWMREDVASMHCPQVECQNPLDPLEIRKGIGVQCFDGYTKVMQYLASETDPEALLVAGTIYKNGSVILDPFTYIPSATLDMEPGSKGTYYFVLYDEGGKELGRTGIPVIFYRSDPAGGPVDEISFAYRIEWKAATKKVVLQDEKGKVLYSRTVSDNKPTVELTSVRLADSRLEIAWEAEDKDGDALTYSLWMSPDEGRTYLPIETGLTEKGYAMDAEGLGQGAKVLIKVRASDGVNTGEDVLDEPVIMGSAQAAAGAEEKADNTWLMIAGAAVLVLALSVLLPARKGKKKQATGRHAKKGR